MSIERAIEILEELGNFKDTTDEYHNGIMRGYWSALQILKEESEPPCERCVHWHKFGGKGKKVCCQSRSQSHVCKYHPFLKDFFEPKEANETSRH